jgi:hypothetical protein
VTKKLEAPFVRLGAELEAAAKRQVVTTPARAHRRRRQWRPLAVAIAALIVSAGAVSWAATSLLAPGAPVPFQHGAPIAGRAQGAPIPGTVKLLISDVADPDGGPPWALRYWETDRKYACVQVGRIYDGKLGEISDDKVFHELRLGVVRTGLGGCFVLDGSGHAFVAIHTDAQRGAQPQPCPTGFRIGSTIQGPHGTSIRCTTPSRTVDFGLLGPGAERFTYRQAGRDHMAMPAGGVGAYLVVQRHLRPVVREYGFHHKDPKLNLSGPAEPYIALTPASQVIRHIDYAQGPCAVRVTASPYGSCGRQAGYVPIPQPRVGDVRTRVRAFAAPDRRGIRVRFRARQAVVDGRTGYDIEVRPDGGRGFMTQTYSRNVAAGAMVRTTVPLYNHRRGGYRIVVRFRTVRSRPGPYATPAWPGVLVGQVHVTVP